MAKTQQEIASARKHALILDIVMVVFFGAFFTWMYTTNGLAQGEFLKVFGKLNPLTVGTYCLGIVTVIHFSTFRNIFGRILMLLFYVATIVASFIIVGGTKTMMNVFMLFPHILILLLLIYVVVKKRRS